MKSKERLKSLLYGYELRSTAAIANGLVHHTPKRVVLNQIKRDLSSTGRSLGLDNNEIGHLWLDSVYRYNKISKQTFSGLRKSNSNYKDDLENRRNIVYKSVRNELDTLEKNKNLVADVYEMRVKHDETREMLSDGVFYLCSSHKNPATDHADYQGRVYVSEDWEDRVDESLIAPIRACIRNRHIMTVESVVYEPPYLTTRRNCKHYLIPVSPEEVLRSSVRSLLKRHDMIVENKPPMSESMRAYKKYYDRLKTLKSLGTMLNGTELNDDIKKVSGLVRKWGCRAKSELKEKGRK